MIKPIQTSIPQEDGTDRHVIIEPILKKDPAGSWMNTGIYKVFKDSFGDTTRLFTEPLEQNGQADDLPDEQNPDYLGKFVFHAGELEYFEGDVLSLAEQAYLAVVIQIYQEPDIL